MGALRKRQFWQKCCHACAGCVTSGRCVVTRSWGRPPRGAAILAGAAFAVIAGIASGFAFTVAETGVVKLPFVPDDCPDFAMCAAAPWSWTVVPIVTTAVAVPTLICAAAATLIGGWIRARAVFVVTLVWCLGAFVPMLSPPGYAAVAVLASGLLQTARVARTRLLRAPSGGGIGIA